MFESGPTRYNAYGLHVGVARRATGANDIAWRKPVSELSVRHTCSLVAAGAQHSQSPTNAMNRAVIRTSLRLTHASVY
jgi:hypothetical protein